MTTRTSIKPHWKVAPLLLMLLAACGGGGGGGGGSSADNGASLISGGGSQSQNNPSANTGSGSASGTGLRAASHCLAYNETAASSSTGIDRYFNFQWYLVNNGQLRNSTSGVDLNVQDVWASGRQGEGIRVAIIDDAVEVTHDDLKQNVVPGASKNYRSQYGNARNYPLPCTTDDSHGTPVAGIIAARGDNGVGIKGIAPRAGIVGLNALAREEDADVLDALTHDNNKNHIYNNSWGANDDGHFHRPSPSEITFRTTISQQLSNGRGGLGSIFVFAAGNGGHYGDYSSYDGNVTELGTLAICAHNAQNVRSAFSEPGPNLLVCGPSGDVSDNSSSTSTPPAIVSTAIQNKFTDEFNGTSAAAPMASGVIALMLQANPQLTWRDVRLVLAESAKKIDPQNTGWTSYGKYNYNHEYGFGALDANAAVNLARSWQSVGGSASLKKCGPYRAVHNQLIPEASTVQRTSLPVPFSQLDLKSPVPGGFSSTIPVPAACDIQQIEHVDVRLNILPADASNTGAGDLQISLTSPSGQTSTLMTPHVCANSIGLTPCQGLNGFKIGLTRHMGEPAATAAQRDWTLTAVDRVQNLRSTLLGWELTIYGR